jgi:D-3-phosphoglycerate dehydrogenase
MDIKRVLICDNVSPRCAEIMEAAGIAVDTKMKLKEDEIIAIIGNYDAMVVRSATTVTKKIVEAGSSLKIIGRAGTGYDNIDTEVATSSGVIVMNTPGGNTVSAAEHTCALLMAMCRYTPQAHESMRAGKWDRSKFMGVELMGKTLAVIGLGRIGREVSTRMQAFGMRVIGYDPILPTEVAKTFNIESLPLDDIWPQCDFITVHTPLTTGTRNLLNAAVFAKCKKGVRIVNCARGGIISENDLFDALNSEQVACAALDVFEEEPPKNRALITHANLISTPHLGASTREAQVKVAEEIADQIVAAKKGEAIQGVVNAPALVNAMKESLQPWVNLAMRLGMLAAQLLGGDAFGEQSVSHSLSKLTVRVQGKSLQAAASTLVNAALVGMLNTLHSNDTNLVNAPSVAEQVGLNVVEERSNNVHSSYVNALALVYETDANTKSEYIGTVFGSDRIRLVTVDGHGFEIFPAGNLVFYSNEDKPGVLAAVSSLFAKANVNISDFNMSHQDDGPSLTILNTDDSVPDETLEKLRAINFVKHVRRVVLPHKIKPAF